MGSFSDLVKEYYNKNNHGLSEEQIKNICYSPFDLVSQVMASGDLKDIRLKYFGVFEVSESRVKYSKKTLKENFEKGSISEDRYNKRIKVLDSYE